MSHSSHSHSHNHRQSNTHKRRYSSISNSSSSSSEDDAEAEAGAGCADSDQPRRLPVWGVFGLGNVGEQFVGTRHNIGMDIVTSYAAHLGTPMTKENIQTRSACQYVQNNSFPSAVVIIGCPTTFMNMSGRAVRGICDHYRILPKRCIVVYDDMDLELGTIRIRNSGSAGGQNGVANVIKCMGDKGYKFIRVRVGIGRPTSRVSNPTSSALGSISHMLVSDESRFVLSPFASSDSGLVSRTRCRVFACISTLIRDGLQRAMNEYNKTAEQADAWEQQQKENIKQKKKEKEKENISHNNNNIQNENGGEIINIKNGIANKNHHTRNIKQEQQHHENDHDENEKELEDDDQDDKEDQKNHLHQHQHKKRSHPPSKPPHQPSSMQSTHLPPSQTSTASLEATTPASSTSTSSRPRRRPSFSSSSSSSSSSRVSKKSKLERAFESTFE